MARSTDGRGGWRWLPHWLIGGMIAAAALGGCGDDDKPGAGGDVLGDGDGGGIPSDPWAAPAETDDFRVLFNYRGRLPSNSDQSELWMIGADGSNPQALTSFGKLEDLDPPLSCRFGCFVSPDMKWLVVVTGPPTEEGFNLSLGKFNSNLQVSILKGGDLTGVIDFKFAGDRLFYSKRKSCVGPSCQYEFFVIELADNVNQSLPFLDFPSANEIEGSTYRGRFRVSPDGTTMVLLRTTIRSVNVYMWKDGVGLVELDFMCKFGTRDNCTGTGSEYSDNDPVAISPDNRWVAFFAFADRWQRIHLYDTQNPGNAIASIVASVPSGSYIEQACQPGVLADWQWQRTKGDAWFTPDGKEVVFVGENACPVGGVQPPKPATDLRRIKVETLMKGLPLTADDVFNVTKNAVGDVTLNRRIDSFALAGDGATAIFVATPTFDQSGNLIADGSARQRNDREVFRVRLDGTNIQQLTNDLSFQAESPVVIQGR
jgi:hypothetical protein